MHSQIAQGDLQNFIVFTRKILAVLEFCSVAVQTVERQEESQTITIRDKNFDDFRAFCRKLGHWEIAAMLDKCQPLRWNPEVPRFKFAAPDWERTSLSLLYKADLVELLTKYCDGRKPRYVVFCEEEDTGNADF